MSVFSLQYPAKIQARAHARNGLYPDARFYVELAGAQNHTLSYRKKPCFTRAMALGNTSTGDDPATFWRGYFITGYGTQKLALCGIMGLAYDWRGASPVTNTADPNIRIAVTKVGGATTNTDWHYGGTTATPTDAPSEWGTHYTEIDVDPASAYHISVTSNDYARVICLTAHEIGRRTVDDANNYYTEAEAVAGAAILDSDIQKIIQGPSLMLGQNGGLVSHWGLYNGAARTRSAASWVNLIDNSSTSPPTSTSPGYRFVTTGRNSKARPTAIPVTVAVYGSIGAGSGSVTLRSTGGSDVVTVTINGAAGWYTASGNITVGTGQKFDIGYIGDGANTMSVYAVSVYENG